MPEDRRIVATRCGLNPQEAEQAFVTFMDSTGSAGVLALYDMQVTHAQGAYTTAENPNYNPEETQKAINLATFKAIECGFLPVPEMPNYLKATFLAYIQGQSELKMRVTLGTSHRLYVNYLRDLRNLGLVAETEKATKQPKKSGVYAFIFRELAQGNDVTVAMVQDQFGITRSQASAHIIHTKRQFEATQAALAAITETLDGEPTKEELEEIEAEEERKRFASKQKPPEV